MKILLLTVGIASRFYNIILMNKEYSDGILQKFLSSRVVFVAKELL